ncbi:hypothetical protein AAF712_010192 [Marasmius tenuissimus]|uniref:Uncharacterized protein n=1 Tax=Marasmius tenuissimus TaxID=585030 RepID=A0ABR2ZNU6_9AGAR
MQQQPHHPPKHGGIPAYDFQPGPSPGDIAHAEVRAAASVSTPSLSPVQPLQQLTAFGSPAWSSENSPPAAPLVDPTLMNPPPTPSSSLLFSNSISSHSPPSPTIPFGGVAPLALGSLPPITSPLLSPSTTLASFPALLIGASYSRAEVVQEFNTLRMKIRELEQRVQHETYQRAAMQKSIDSWSKQVGQGFSDMQRDYECKIQELRELIEATRADERSSVGDSGDEEERKDVEGAGDEPVAAMAGSSVELASTHKIKDMVKKIFYLFLGTRALKKMSDFPEMKEGQTEDSLPLVKGSDEIREIRFDWNATGRSRHNVNKLSAMVTHSRKVGPTLVAGVGEILPKITDSDLLNRFVATYSTLRRNWKGPTVKKADEPAGLDAPLDNTKHANRASGKLKVRNRKRANAHTLEDAKWVQDTKYDAAFEVNHMSDDDDCYDENGQLVKSQYSSREPTYRSELCRKVYNTVDGVPDPAPSNQYLARVKGKPKEQPIRRAAEFAKRGRTWMYDSAWLKTNPEYSGELYVLHNGTAWGDPTDPVQQEGQKKDVKAEKKEKKKRKSDAEPGTGGKPAKKGKGAAATPQT